MLRSCKVKKFSFAMLHDETSVKENLTLCCNYKVKRKKKVNSSSFEKLEDYCQQKKKCQSGFFL